MEALQESFLPCSSLGSSSSLSNPKTFSIDVELWWMAEQRIQEILWTIQPNVVSEWRRNGLIGYVQRLIKGLFGTEVFSFGSVPLKAYLPDGDIDLTAVCHQNVEEDLARAVCDALESQPKDSWFQIKDVRYVQAQVKVVKCTVNNIAMDISFNQMAGLCTLCFLEQVDQEIGKDHLFKKSIILIKAWCYYESRILGAHYGLISTYALETLVLYIINLFHSSLRGPLEVLHRFLEYYSTFDWDNYCISINGPVAISSLPEIIVTPQNQGEELLLGEEFMKNCRDVFSDPTRAYEASVHEFQTKYLNIVDPLKDDNNLGRSVSKGNFYRIKAALSYGAEILREIFMLRGERMGLELEKFFNTTIDRNGRGQRPDVRTPIPAFGTGTCEASNLTGDESHYGAMLYGQAFHIATHPIDPPCEDRNGTTWNALAWSAQLNWNLFCQRATNVYPRLPLRYPSASQSSAATLGVENIRKSKGTGTFIPAVPRNYSRYWRPKGRGRGRILDSRTHNSTMRSTQNNDQVEVPTEAGTSQNASCFNLSSEEFPLLPGAQSPPPSEVHQSGRPVLVYPPPKGSPRTFSNYKLGSFELSPSQLGMPSSGVSRMGMQKHQERPQLDEERIRREQFKLDNDEDFPPLAL